MKEMFIDEQVFKNIDHEVKEYDIQNYSEEEKKTLQSEWKLITLQWNLNGWILVFLIVGAIGSAIVFTVIGYISHHNGGQSTKDHILLLLVFTLIIIFLGYNLCRLLIYRRKWKERIKKLGSEINKIK